MTKPMIDEQAMELPRNAKSVNYMPSEQEKIDQGGEIRRLREENEQQAELIEEFQTNWHHNESTYEELEQKNAKLRRVVEAARWLADTLQPEAWDKLHEVLRDLEKDDGG